MPTVEGNRPLDQMGFIFIWKFLGDYLDMIKDRNFLGVGM